MVFREMHKHLTNSTLKYNKQLPHMFKWCLHHFRCMIIHFNLVYFPNKGRKFWDFLAAMFITDKLNLVHADVLMFRTRIQAPIIQSEDFKNNIKILLLFNINKLTRVVVFYCYQNYFNNIQWQLHVRYTNIEKINNSSFISTGTSSSSSSSSSRGYNSHPTPRSLKILPLILNNLKINILM